MNLLLDTHVLLWWLSDDQRLGERARGLIADPENTVYLSAVVLWEIRIKEAIGKLDLPADFRTAVDSQGFTELPLTLDHTDALAELPLHHGDPFDRMLIAQARSEDLTVLTADHSFRKYEVPVASV
jgi:PIN domain nuclease of toxin-antitoxin system